MDLLDLVFPKKCVNCGAYGKYVCEKCDVGLWEEEQICPVCRQASRYGLRHRYCREPWSMDGLTCLWAYDGLARRMISQVKYKFYFDYLSELLSEVSVRVSARPEMTNICDFLALKPVVVPVPLWPKRERERGFNQAEVIGRLVAGCWSLDMKNLLSRVRDTGRQVERTRKERLEAVNNAFRINEKLPYFAKATQGSQNLRILLVDDVWTTGATMNECAKVLKRAGVKRVWGLVLAR